MKLKNTIGALLAFGLAGVALPNALAQDKPSPEAEAKLSQSIKARYSDVNITSIKKSKRTDLDLYGVEFTSQGKKMDADIAGDGTILETEEEADIKTFPKPAATALKKAIKGLKTEAIEINRKYAEVQKNDSGGVKVVKLASPVVAYEADVANAEGKTGEFGFSADGALLESPKWLKSEAAKPEAKVADAADEKDEAVTLDQVPEAVKKTLKEYAADSEVKKIAKGDVDGTAVYEFDIEQGARKFELTITPKGRFFGTEEEVQLADVPEAARTSINQQAAGGKVVSVEKAVDPKKKTTYESVIEKDGKKVEVVFNTKGKVVSTEAVGKD